jgi:ribonuclease HI
VDRVSEIAAAIAALQPGEKERLFRLLARQGNLPEEVATAAPVSSQLELEMASPQSLAAPDYVLIFDGGSRGNPGHGYGSYVIRREQDNAQRLQRLDLGDGYTNNEAEYDTLIAAVQDLLGRIEEAERQPQEFVLEVRGDSALVLNQLQGQWKAKEPRMRARRDLGLRLLRRFRAVVFKLQPREESVRILGH